MIETLANCYSSERTQRELSNEYQHDSVWMDFKNRWIFVLGTKVVSALEGLNNLKTSLLFKYADGILPWDCNIICLQDIPLACLFLRDDSSTHGVCSKLEYASFYDLTNCPECPIMY